MSLSTTSRKSWPVTLSWTCPPQVCSRTSLTVFTPGEATTPDKRGPSSRQMSAAERAIALSAGDRSLRCRALDVVIHRELVRVRPQANRVNLVRALVVDPRLDDVRREDATLDQVGVVPLQLVEHCLERPGHLRDRRKLVRR